MRDFLLTRSGAVLLGFLAVAGYFLWLEHRAHIISSLPLILVGACVVMHLFMHRRHGSRGASGDGPDQMDRPSGDRHE